MGLVEEKKQLRKQMLLLRDVELPKQDQEQGKEGLKDETIRVTNRVLQSEAYQKATLVLLYVAYRNEISTKPLLDALFEDSSKKVAVPKVYADGRMEFYEIASMEDLEAGYHGILEPIPSAKNLLDPSNRFGLEEHQSILMILPAVAVDRKGNRLGYGGGYYDRYLERMRFLDNKSCAAICYDAQIIEKIPTQETDAKVDVIYTAWETIVNQG